MLVFANFKTDVDSSAHDSPLYNLPILVDVLSIEINLYSLVRIFLRGGTVAVKDYL